MRGDPERLLPTVERARLRGIELPDGLPLVERPLAAVTVVARAQTRQSFEEKMELAVAVAEQLPREPPPVGEGFVTATHRFLARASEPRACSMCAFRPGFTSCIGCSGSGAAGGSGDSIERCIACDGEGWVRCATCDGKRTVVKAVIRRVEDHAYALRHTFVPESASGLSASLVQEVLDREPHELLRFDLDARTAIAPYRTADDAPRRASFLGHELENALDLARLAVERLTLKETLVRSEVQAWAWPFLWLEWVPNEPCLLVSVGEALLVVR